MMRLLCAISQHGLGHLAQTAPVMHALSARRPDIAWLVWSALSRPVLESRLRLDFKHRHAPADIGLLMHDALSVDTVSSQCAYLRFHRHWAPRVAREADWLRRQGIQGVLCNAAYLPLAAAARAGVPALAFGSLNWWDIVRHYLETDAGMPPILAQIQSAYARTWAFLRLRPALPMAWLDRAEDLPPVAMLGQPRRDVLRAGLGLPATRRLVLLGFGGVAYRQDRPLPRHTDLTWLVPDAWDTTGRPDMVPFGRVDLPFPDLLASCDALVTKVGYGSFVEAAGLGLPVLYLDRPDWPETPWLTSWLARHARQERIGASELFSDAIRQALERLWQAAAVPAAEVSGAPVVARRILEILGG
ncbi:MAG TPA: hypothetical protein PKH69_06610 [Thiobacillaceae bacterium]|nr:hypothetical protein [Thiobacillaceae bacterium]HNU63837.1 hypothetical protein [Thiobacillaceae bacterium]